MFFEAAIMSLASTLLRLVLFLPLCSTAVRIGVTAGERKGTTPVAFLHIPKNGGTSLNHYFYTNWAERCDRLPLQGATPESVLRAAAASRGEGRCSWVHVHVGGSESTRDAFRDLAACHGLRPRYLTGHLDFGSCSYLEPGCEYVTIFRDPLARMISHYQYLAARHPQLLQSYCAPCGGCPSFEAYVDGVHSGLVWFYGAANHQTLFMAGNEHFQVGQTCADGRAPRAQTEAPPGVPFSAGARDERILEAAKRNLVNRTMVFGFLDDLDTFQMLMEARYGYRRVPIPTLNQVTGLSVEQLDLATIRKMQEIQSMDMELIAFARTVLKERLQQYPKPQPVVHSSSHYVVRGIAGHQAHPAKARVPSQGSGL